jgi:hypothetical protein
MSNAARRHDCVAAPAHVELPPAAPTVRVPAAHLPSLRRVGRRIAMTLRLIIAGNRWPVLTNAREVLALTPRCLGGVLGIWWATPKAETQAIAHRSFRVVTILFATNGGAQQCARQLRRRGNIGVQVLDGQLRLFVDGQAVTGYAVLAPISADRDRATGWWQAPALATQPGYRAEKARRANAAESSYEEHAAWAERRDAFLDEAEPDYLLRDRRAEDQSDEAVDGGFELSYAAEADLAAIESAVNAKFLAETDFDSPFEYLGWRQRCQEAARANTPMPPIRSPRPRNAAKAAAYDAWRQARRTAQAAARRTLREQVGSLDDIAAAVCGQTSPAADLLELARRRNAALWAGWNEAGAHEEALISAGRRERLRAQGRAVAAGAALLSEDAAHALHEA